MRTILTFFVFLPFLSLAQIGVNTTTPNAALDIQSTNKGVLIPRVQLTDALDSVTVVNPAGGALATSTLIYNTVASGIVPNNVLEGFYYWDGGRWINVSGSIDWNIDGNTAINSPSIPVTYGTTAIGTTENFIGTKDNNDVVIGTDNIERLRIKNATGNVGIGTANPTTKLDIVAPNNEIGLQILSGNNSQLAYLSIGRTQEHAQVGSCTSTSFFLDALDGDMAIKNFGLGKILLGASVNTNAAMSIVPGGNVGIGTVTPSLARFQVDGMTGNTTALFRGSPTSQGISLAADWPGIYFNSYFSGGQRAMSASGFPSIINANQGSGGLSFHTSNTPNTVANALLPANVPERMRIDADGDVGIGINNPLTKLHVFNPTAGAIQIQDGTQVDGNVLSCDANGVGTWRNPNSFTWSLNGNSGTNPPSTINFPIATTENFIGTTDYEDLVFGANNMSRMKISAFGNVGIGIDNPNAKFHINDNNSPYITSWITKTNLSGGTLGGYVSPTLVVSTTSTNGGTSEKYINSEFIAIGANSATNIAANFYATGAANNYAIIVPENSGDVGFGVINPSTKLHIVDTSSGALRIEDGTQAAGRVLTSDANGVGTWQAPNSNFWSLSGNTVAASNFIGSTNNANIIFRRNNAQAGTIAQFNTSLGVNAMNALTTGTQNVAIGTNALDSNIISGGNTAVGYDALQSTTGDFNTAFGNSALFSLIAGTSNCAFGYNALNNQISGINNIGIGTGANVPFTTGNNQIRMGNTSIAYAGIQVSWSITSDKRWKSEIQTSNLGLNFINKLNPVSYIRKNDENKKTEYGFIAQELDQTLNEFGATNSGIITKDDAGMLSVRYNDLLSPMVKAIQELKTENDMLKKQNESLEARLKKIEEKINN